MKVEYLTCPTCGEDAIPQQGVDIRLGPFWEEGYETYSCPGCCATLIILLDDDSHAFAEVVDL